MSGEVLGEVAGLVERLEAVSAELREVAKVRAADGTAETLARMAGTSAAKVRAEFDRSAEMACRRLGAVAHETARAARELQGMRWRDYIVWAVVYLGASMVGGAVVALALRMA